MLAQGLSLPRARLTWLARASDSNSSHELPDWLVLYMKHVVMAGTGYGQWMLRLIMRHEVIMHAHCSISEMAAETIHER